MLDSWDLYSYLKLAPDDSDIDDPFETVLAE